MIRVENGFDDKKEITMRRGNNDDSIDTIFALPMKYKYQPPAAATQKATASNRN
jgi:hypothetical protein